ncbi:TlpA disulfide reductase family protein [Aurantimonas sp. VKM B-3413]|uniref:thiol:disulfide interchange protein TlpA n=1 Tax=Aurantimonas sp. VKM B-3413 TaxID=2779401 RepID=UPI001E35738F|nr:TlpA family protein disulfide reductase [Aurantimonas sp. VKM B-3413]MCB8837373.1 TlpA family protein disulfide reductase [Aurantimonas sp. VKM B-3413]
MSANDRTPSGGRRLTLIAALALVCGVAAGGAVLYVSETGSGNEVAGGCPVDKALADAIAAGAQGEVAAVQPLDTPFSVSAISFEDKDGQTRSLADFSGKTLLVNMWATWCVPCRAEMPALDALERKEGGADFAVVPINVDLGENDKPERFYAETELTALPLYRDATMGVFNDLKSQGVAFGLPVSLLVGPDGCARAAINGPAEWASPDAVKLIEAVRKTGGV